MKLYLLVRKRKIQKVGNGRKEKRRTYRERRCGIADSCGPYLGICASQRDRNNEKVRKMNVTVRRCHRVRRAGWRVASCFWERPELLMCNKRVSIRHGARGIGRRTDYARAFAPGKVFCIL